ncbi:MAG: hypothetical protein N2380_10265 [bacterium]|nr:hypothetical protein [bacterium]
MNKKIRTLGLGISLKPFKDKSKEFIYSKIVELLCLWFPLMKEAEEIWFNFLIGNGDLILTWDGNPDSEFEWDHYKGHNNPLYGGYSFEPIKLRNYIEDWIHFTYNDLKFIFSSFKSLLEREGLNVKIIVNIEPGPEFSESSFRYIRHPEILEFQGGGHGNSISFRAKFNKDNNRYASYLDGIPEGEPFGKFLGKQIKKFIEFIEIDGVSFSNGLGFGTHPWSLIGHNFDGKRFNLVNFDSESKEIEEFWNLLREEVPEIIITAQGTNWPIGVDISAKCVPIKDIYKNYLTRPLSTTVSVFFNDSLGFAMASYLSRIAPVDSFDFGYYLLDPWYPQDAWEDFPYDHQPFDIYCPMSSGVINAEGEIISADSIICSAVNDDNGDYCEDIVYEVIPHLRKAISHRPDKPGILVWLYPFDEYNEVGLKASDLLDNLFFWDCFTASCIDNGLPLNTVISTTNFGESNFEILRNSILYTCIPLYFWNYSKKVEDFVRSGGNVIVYGSILHTDDNFRRFLNLKVGDEIDREIELYRIVGKENFNLYHESDISGGPIVEELADPKDPYTKVIYEAIKGDVRKIYASLRSLPEWNGGKILWIRGTLPFTLEGENIYFKDPLPAKILRFLLEYFGYCIKQIPEEYRNGQIFISRSNNAYIFSGYKPDTTVQILLRFPEGAPIFFNYDVSIKDGGSLYYLPKSFHEECRIFIKQSLGKIKCRRTLRHEFTEDEIELNGLNRAEITFYPPEDKLENVQVNPKYNLEVDMDRRKIRIKEVEGKIIISW